LNHVHPYRAARVGRPGRGHGAAGPHSPLPCTSDLCARNAAR
jgi:hypothetical protein